MKASCNALSLAGPSRLKDASHNTLIALPHCATLHMNACSDCDEGQDSSLSEDFSSSDLDDDGGDR